jgi:hypothetical protein
MTDPAVADLDLHLLAAERAGIELEGGERLTFGGGGVGFEFRAHIFSGKFASNRSPCKRGKVKSAWF